MTRPHPKFQTFTRPSEAREAALVAAIAELAREVWPDAAAICVNPIHAMFCDERLGRSSQQTIELRDRRRRTTQPGTVGAVATKAARILDRATERLTVGDGRGDTVERGERLVRASALAGNLAHVAGDIPAAEFGEAEWLAFVASVPVRFRRRELVLLVRALERAGLRIHG